LRAPAFGGGPQVVSDQVIEPTSSHRLPERGSSALHTWRGRRRRSCGPRTRFPASLPGLDVDQNQAALTPGSRCRWRWHDHDDERTRLIRIAADYRTSWSALVDAAQQADLVDDRAAHCLRSDQTGKG
jgi:hypothetical protein